MKERGILFSGPMVRALLEGKKTQTRRLMKPQPSGLAGLPGSIRDEYAYILSRCPYGVPGDRLWVRETCLIGNDDCPTHQLGYPPGSPCWCGKAEHVRYRADGEGRATRMADAFGWRPAIHMPRWASRITLDITNVRAQRLHDISKDDERAEGVEPGSYAALWDSINGDRAAWSTNPWVWAVSFNRTR